MDQSHIQSKNPPWRAASGWKGQFLRYLVTGGLAFVLDFSIFSLLLYGLKMHYLGANLVALLGGLLVNYLMSVRWVFAGAQRTLGHQQGAELSVFIIIGLLGVAGNQLLMFVMIDLLQWMEILAKAVAAVLVLFWNFGARKLILFRFKQEEAL